VPGSETFYGSPRRYHTVALVYKVAPRKNSDNTPASKFGGTRGGLLGASIRPSGLLSAGSFCPSTILPVVALRRGAVRRDAGLKTTGRRKIPQMAFQRTDWGLQPTVTSGPAEFNASRKTRILSTMGKQPETSVSARELKTCTFRAKTSIRLKERGTHVRRGAD